MSNTLQVSLRRRALPLIYTSRFNNTKIRLVPLQGRSQQQWRNASVLAQNFGGVTLEERLAKANPKSKNRGQTPEKDRGVKHVNPTLRDRDKVRAMGTWLSWNGKDIDDAQVLRQLPIRLTQAHIDTAIFFVTPKFAHLLEPDGNFLNAAMQHMFPVAFQKDPQGMKSIVAIVDNIPVIAKANKSTLYTKTAEGIALCLTAMPEISLDSQHGQGDAPVISLVTKFKTPSGAGLQQRYIAQKARSESPSSLDSISLAFTYSGATANTLFVNGRKHTMVLQKWDRVQAAILRRPEIEHLSLLNIPIYDSDSQEYLCTRMETWIQKITEPAKIVSSMGNILREISNDKDEIISASHELESLVPAALKDKQQEYPDCEIRVHALIYPDKGPHESKLHNVATDRVSSYRLHDLLCIDGARLFRVTSGGAGWGKKAGLLSLNPITQINQPPTPESASSFFPGFEIEEDEAEKKSSAEGKLLPEGHYVQFLASFEIPPKKSLENIDPEKTWAEKPEFNPQWRQTDYFKPSNNQILCVGTSAYEAHPSLQDIANETQNRQPKKTYFSPNKFGFISTSPISVSVVIPGQDSNPPKGTLEKGNQNSVVKIPHKVIHSTIVELPHGSFSAESRTGGARVVPEDSSVEMIHPQVAEIMSQMERMPGKVDKEGLKEISDLAENNKLVDSEASKQPQFRTRYIETFFQTATGKSRPGDLKRFNRAITTSGMIRKLRAYHDKEALLKRIIALTMGHRRIKKLEKNQADLKGLTEVEEDEESEENGPIIRKTRSEFSIRKVNEHDNRVKAEYTDYRARDAEAFKEDMRQRNEDMAPLREKRYAAFKSVETEGGTGIFDRQRKQQKQEKDAVQNLFDDLEGEGSGTGDKKS